VIDIGKTPGGRTLHVIKVSTGGEEGEKSHPCVLMYAREHADEHDSSWLVTGALRRVIATDEVAKNLRARVTFLFIPILDMDAAAKCQHQGIILTFRAGTSSEESRSYANFFHAWVAAGKRLDVVLNLHNVESSEGSHMTWVLPTDQQTKELAQSLHDAFRSDLNARGFNVAPNPWQMGTFPLRLVTWLGDNFGSIALPYETNSQQPDRHLSQAEFEAMGGAIAVRSASFFASSQGKMLLSNVDDARKAYVARWDKYSPEIKETDALTAEQRCLNKAHSDELLRQFEAGKIGPDGKLIEQ
jgi:hypothetical protein